MKSLLSLLVLLSPAVTFICQANVTQRITPVEDTSKAGTCPPQQDLSLSPCTRICTSDKECPSVYKCCTTFCDGAYCQIPNDKPGQCPPVVASDQTTCAKVTSCQSDTKCDEDLKCCPTACNKSSCQKPV
ncbi:WAP four-disulfide core domain protein 18-like [Hyperolius riggenbachi]|uniref:WAP four-disulfide core domain protein 18-like n=1 Tax=Hyperolius riggenbachi TaxID=752182 RepID=UPI0035A27B7C